MGELNWNHKQLIVKLLATGEDPEEIAEKVYGASLVKVTPEQIPRFDPARSGTELSTNLRRLYEETHAEYRKETKRAAEAETVFVTTGTFREAVEWDRLREEGSLSVELNGREIALFALGEERSVRALDNSCTHQGGPLCEGTITGGEVECPWHGARFDLESGEVRRPPAAEGVGSYETRIQGDSVEVRV